MKLSHLLENEVAVLEKNFLQTKVRNQDVTIYIDPSSYKLKRLVQDFRLRECRFVVYNDTMFAWNAGLASHMDVKTALERNEGYSFNSAVPYAVGMITPEKQQPTPSEWLYSSKIVKGRYRYDAIDIAFYTGTDASWDDFKKRTNQRLCKQIVSNGIEISKAVKGE